MKDSEKTKEQLIQELNQLRKRVTENTPLPKNSAANAPPKVLIVDDIETNLLLLENILEPIDIEIDKAFSGYEAIEKVKQNTNYAIALIDVQMPELDGFETVEKIREIEHTKSMPIIFLSAIYSENYYKIKGIKSGAVDFIHKPIVEEMLQGKVKNFIEQYKQRQIIQTYVSKLQSTISELKKAELENRKFFAAIEQSSNGIVITDTDGHFQFVNKGFEKTTGYTKDEVIGQKTSLLKTGYSDNATYRKLWRTILSGKVWQGEFFNQKKDGTTYWEEATITPIFDENNNITNFIGIKEDITEKKRIKSQLESQNKFLNSIINSITFPFYVIDIKNKGVIYANNATKNKSPQSTVSHRSDIYFTTKTEDTPLQQVLADKKPVMVSRTRSENDNEHLLEIHCYPIFSNNEIVAIIEYTLDVTDKKHVERELEQYRKRLEDLVLERTDDLQKAKEEAEESDRLKTAFLANMSHELRTPLNAILGFSAMLSDNSLSGEEKAEFISHIEENTNYLLQLFEDILDIAKIESGQLKLKMDYHPLKQIIKNVAQTASNEKQELAKPQVEIEAKEVKGANNISLYTDIERLYQVLNNLVKNAVKFTERGKVEIQYEIQDAKMIKFWVSDTGIGIPDNKIDDIFDRFHKITTEEKLYRGTGLGLSISKNIIKMLGGDMWVKSTVQVGSTFFFTIPYKPVDKTNNVILTKKELNWEEKIILIAEDKENNYIYLEETLFPTNVKLIWAKDGKQAVEIYQRNPEIDLILMDIHMPEMDGMEAMKRIKKINPDIPIIAQTAFTLSSDVDNIIEAGFNDYLPKSINKNRLFSTLKKYI